MPRGGRYGAPGGFGGGGTDDGDGGTDSDDSDSSRDRTVTSPSFDPGGFDGGGSTGGGDDDRDRDRDRDDDSGSSSSGSTGPSRQGRNDRTDGDAGATITDPAPAPDPTPDPAPSPGGSSPPVDDVGGPADPAPAPEPEPPAADDPGPVFGDGSSGGGGGGGSPGGSSPPVDDVGGPSGPAPNDPTADMVADDPGPVFGPGPGTDGGLGDPDPGGDGGEIVDDTVEAVESAEANDEIVDRATTGGLLSERGESAGLFPATLGDGGGAAIGDGRVDISETRLRDTAEESLAFGQSIDAAAVFSSPADPVTDNRRVGADAPPGSENPAEEFIEGAAALPFDAPGALAETETVAEAGQSLVDDDLVADFGAGTVGETATAQTRDRAEETAAAIGQNPAGFAGAVTAGAVVGAGGLSRGSTGTLRQAARAELDPRIGPFGETLESQAFSRFLADDRGQAQLVPESRDRGTDTDSGTGTDDDLGPDLDPFDRSDSRLLDPNREFDDDLGGMADAGPAVDPSDASSRQDIGAGVGGRGEPGIVGSDADSFSSRGFGDVSGTELDPNPTATLVDDLDTPGAATGGLLAAPESDLDALSGADGLLGAPDDLDSTGTTADLGDRTRTVTAPTFDADVFDDPTDAGPDTTTDVFSVSRTGPDLDSDTPTDTDPVDTPMFDNPTDTPTDPPTDTPTDPPSDPPSDPPTFDTPDDPPERFPPGLGNAPDARSDGLRLETEGEVVENPTQTLEEADRFVVDTISDNF